MILSRSTATTIKAAPAVSAELSSAEIGKRAEVQRSRLSVLSDRKLAVQQERELRKKSDPNITPEIISDFNRREAEIDKEITDTRESVDALETQLHLAGDREWVAVMTKWKSELEADEPRLEKLYDELDAIQKQWGKILCELMTADVERRQFSRATDERVGYVAFPEHKVRHLPKGLAGNEKAYTPRPIWDEIVRIPSVFPGDGYIDIVVGAVRDAPRKPNAPAYAPRFAATGPGSAAITVHGAAARPEPPPIETDFHGRPLIRTADEASAARDSRDADASPSLVRDVHGYGR